MNTEEIFKRYKKYHTPWVKAEEKVYRNDPCICGSGKKSKNCCDNRTKYRLK